MKDYIMLFLGADYQDLKMSEQEIQGRMGKWFAWNEVMQSQGIVKGGDALHPQIKRVSGPDRTVTDMSSAEIKELVGGYYIVTANSMEEVVEIAQGYPDYDIGGTVEIREIMVFDN
ncbi:MAG: YciI family protein [Bacteroidota bacterium]